MANVLRFGGCVSASYAKVIFDKNSSIDNIGTITKTSVTGTQTITKNTNGIVLTDSGGDGGQGTDAIFSLGSTIDISGFTQVIVEVSTSANAFVSTIRWGSVLKQTITTIGTYKIWFDVSTNDVLKLYSTCTGQSVTYTITRIWLIK